MATVLKLAVGLAIGKQKYSGGSGEPPEHIFGNSVLVPRDLQILWLSKQHHLEQ